MSDLRLQICIELSQRTFRFLGVERLLILQTQVWNNVQPLLPLFVSRSANIVCAKSFVALNPGASTPNGLVVLHQRESGFHNQVGGGCRSTHWLTLNPKRNATTGLAAA